MASSSERLARADARLQADPFDLGAWEVVLTVADASPLAEGRPLYERFLQQFPCAAVQWKALVDSELRARDFASAEAHLGACLRQCPHLGLWGCYIAFVRLTTNDDMARLLEAYELLLDTVGLDVGAVPHWLDYIALLKSNARTEPKLIVRVRGAYQRALMLPLNKLELVWKEYEAWELLINRTLGRQLVAEWQERHKAARRAGRERTALRIAAPLDAPGRPPTLADAPLVTAWRGFLDFELAGSFKLPPADELARATLALEQALLPLRHHAELYHLAALHFAQLGQLEAARSFWARGARVLPGCALLTLAEAEFEERAGNLEQAAGAYERLTRAATGPLAWVHALRFTRRTRGAAAARALFARARRAPSAGWQLYTAAATLEAAAVPEEGGCAEAAAAATQVAVNIFEKGLLAHGAELAYVRSYADFLRARARTDELRALFERTLARVDGEEGGGEGEAGAPSESQLCGLWDAYISLEQELGATGSACALERRRAARHPHAADPLSAQALAARLSYRGLLPCSEDEAALLGVGAGALDAPSFGERAAASDFGGEAAGARPRAGGAGGADGGAALAGRGGAVDGGGPDGGGERERRTGGRPDGRVPRAGGGRDAGGAGRAEGEAARAGAAADEPLGEVEAMLLARRLNAPEPMALLLAALPSPAEFAGTPPSGQELNGLLEVLVQLPPNLHSLVGTAVRLFGGSMGGGAAPRRAPAPQQAVPGAFVSAGAAEASRGLVATADAAPAARVEVKAEGAGAREPAAPPPAPLHAAAPAPLAAPAGARAGSDDSDSDNDEPLARRKRAGGADLYLQRLQKKQNVRPA